MKLLVTGPPGCGKTTLCEKIIDRLKDRFSIGGFVSREIRKGGGRSGFVLKDIRSGDEGILANVDGVSGPSVGRYRVNLSDLNRVGVGSINSGLRDCDLVIIDEIGPMELFSKEFVEAVKEAFSSDRHVIATIHFGTRNRLVEKLGLEKVPMKILFDETRESLVEEIVEKFV